MGRVERWGSTSTADRRRSRRFAGRRVRFCRSGRLLRDGRAPASAADQRAIVCRDRSRGRSAYPAGPYQTAAPERGGFFCQRSMLGLPRRRRNKIHEVFRGWSLVAFESTSTLTRCARFASITNGTAIATALMRNREVQPSPHQRSPGARSGCFSTTFARICLGGNPAVPEGSAGRIRERPCYTAGIYCGHPTCRWVPISGPVEIDAKAMSQSRTHHAFRNTIIEWSTGLESTRRSVASCKAACPARRIDHRGGPDGAAGSERRLPYTPFASLTSTSTRLVKGARTAKGNPSWQRNTRSRR